MSQLYHPGERVRIQWPGYAAVLCNVEAVILARRNQGSKKTGDEWLYEVLIEEQTQPVEWSDGKVAKIAERETFCYGREILEAPT